MTIATTFVCPYVSGRSPGAIHGDGRAGAGCPALCRRALARESPKARTADRTRPMKAPAAASRSLTGLIVSVRVGTFSIPGGNRYTSALGTRYSSWRSRCLCPTWQSSFHHEGGRAGDIVPGRTPRKFPLRRFRKTSISRFFSFVGRAPLGPRESSIRRLEVVLQDRRRPPAQLAGIIGPDPCAPIAEATGLGD